MSEKGSTLLWRAPDEGPALTGQPDITEQTDQECRMAAKKAMDLLLRQDRTKKNLLDRLYRAGYSERASEYAIQYVASFGYVDDLRYAQNYIACHKDSRSRKELRYKLMERGVSSETVEEAFLEYEEEDEYEALRKMLKKRLKGKQISGMDHTARDKTAAYLVRKGFALPAVYAVMAEEETDQ